MAILTEARVRARAAKLTGRGTTASVLKEHASSATASYDVFLKHAKADQALIVGLVGLLEDRGLSVYVDWIEDRELDRTRVTRMTANRLRMRMRMGRCGMLLYVHSLAAAKSLWIPWRLGWFDGAGGKVAIVPVAALPNREFVRQEYLSLYQYVDEAIMSGQSTNRLWINEPSPLYAPLEGWYREETEMHPGSAG